MGGLNDPESTAPGITVYLEFESKDEVGYRFAMNLFTERTTVEELVDEESGVGSLVLRLPYGGYKISDEYSSLHEVIACGENARWSYPIGIERDRIKAVVGDEGDLWVHPGKVEDPHVRAIFESVPVTSE
jgi:hypothetical protein